MSLDDVIEIALQKAMDELETYGYENDIDEGEIEAELRLRGLQWLADEWSAYSMSGGKL